MIVPREPESAGVPAFLLTPPPRPDADAALELIAEASTLVDQADDRRARDALGRVLADGLVRPVSASADAGLPHSARIRPHHRKLARSPGPSSLDRARSTATSPMRSRPCNGPSPWPRHRTCWVGWSD